MRPIPITKEEITEIYQQCDELHESSSLEKRICGILMDIRMGKTGLHKKTAEIKAKYIADLIRNLNVSEDCKTFDNTEDLVDSLKQPW